MRTIRRRFLLTVGVFVLTVAIGRGEDRGVPSVTSYYFGNSFTGNTMPGLHPLLGESAGKRWRVEASIAPGIPIWAHMKKQMDKGPDYEKFQRVAPQTDAIVMLIFGGDGLSSVVTEKWQGKVKFDQPTDIGDIAACSYLIRQYLKLKPDGRAYIYTAWPGIPEVKDLRDRIKQEAIESARRPGERRQNVMQRIKTRKPNHDEMEPTAKIIRLRFPMAQALRPGQSARQHTHAGAYVRGDGGPQKELPRSLERRTPGDDSCG